MIAVSGRRSVALVDRKEPDVGMIIILVPREAEELRVGPTALAQLAELGVTSATLARDSRSIGVVLDGWAFNPERSAEAAIKALGQRRKGTRTLRSLTQMAVSKDEAGRER